MINKHIRTIVLCGLLLALAVVLNLFRTYIPVLNPQGARMSFGTPFLTFAAMLFGPVYGAIVYGLADLLGFALRPEGAFMPLYLVSQIAKGFVIGLLWYFLKKLSMKHFGLFYITASSAVASLMLLVWMPPSFREYVTIESNAIARVSGRLQDLPLLLFALLVISVAAYIIADNRMEANNKDNMKRMIIAVAIPYLLFTTLNTPIIMSFYGIPWSSFLFFWSSRVTKEAVMVVYNISALLILLNVYKRLPQNKV
jgi:ECF transporter S component (folate family)